ncbi:uncharacterized protein EAF01_007619 [Botrytis porri]|uniref:Uncharacterized protein n=1 Tax=Botrytis porri TaxID=87229 RepID=A0A4Z1KTF9_9HELO|nr:uncharacterized protein EAF01_007619 [Botrytis porri]KAF7900317.1 hypothetical protein EAF01_007619 [Botrytis porri]TGO87489.1 hypothetical protein BPOR_0222g00040 [Botrytis porri]
MPDIPSVDLSFEALMSGLGPQSEYIKHTKYTSRIIGLLRLIRDLKDVPDSLYYEARRSCHDGVEELREEILRDEYSLNREKNQDWEIKSGQAGAPLNGRDHQIIKNLLEGAVQKKSEKFEGVGMIRMWSLFTDRAYLDILIKRLKPGHGMQAYRIKPVINKYYRGVAPDRGSCRS